MFNFKLLTLFGLLTALVGAAESANILGVFTSHSPSHLIIHISYARLLADRGHNVTVVTTLPLKDKNPRFHHIYIPPTEARIQDMIEMKAQIAKPKNAFQSVVSSIRAVMAIGPIQYDALKDQRFQDLMHNKDNKFDLVIMGYFFSDYQVGLGLHFRCPTIISWMSAPNKFVDRYIGNPPEIAYVPVSPILGIPDPLTFGGRLSNFFTAAAGVIINIVIDRQANGFYDDLFPSPDYPSMDEAKKKVSLLLCNSHFSEGIIRPNVPAVVEVGGIQVKDKPDLLPKDLQVIFDSSSEHGVIYLSFGSNLGSGDVSPDTFKIIYRTLAGLKQTVVWKWDGTEKLGDAPNIHYQKWLPQDDILAHPNLRLFITHAGKGSVSESQYHGVPMVAIPFFADQMANADYLERDGFGLKVDRNTMTDGSLRAVILEVLENPKYKENVKRFSTLYRDRPMTARATAAYWIEYVIRHKGAYHMQSPLVHLNALQYMSLDVVAFLLLVLFLAYKLIKIPVKFVLRKVCSKCCSKKPTKKPKAKKQ